MTSLVEVARHLPSTEPVAALQEPLGLNDLQLRRFTRLYGLDQICKAPEESETELLLAAARGLDSLRGNEHRVRYVVRGKGLRTTAPYPHSPLQRVRDELGLGHARGFGVADHGCATGLLAIDVCDTLLSADGDPEAMALILTGEKTFTPFTQWVTDVSIMGEGTAAVLVRAGGERDRMLGYASRIYGRADGVIDMNAEVAADARKIYQDVLAEVVLAAVTEAGLELDDIDLLLPHNVNRVSWTVAADNLGIPKRKLFMDNLPRTGHCFCADPFINYRSVVDGGVLRPGDRYLMTSVGLGQTFAAMVFQH
ncbi:3-oxoacyl-[acyl-carrier-protein] synthase III C-terminal domain-containing protein [Saccharopolyspora gloriosae]|uniref:3-oxoacyl-[acyl-carrier-protein] synthase-3 n=1 Tax=Saccharopolyspora gloriosae TaxID=455344 RepID=A0A840NDD2_9PSEU|nr:3-oxoacyl-[acyl-carrier-protein] synthase III C-terminal domain-containing protein [Saccharopolyspora gloriosae]MBB5067232.1 3-oxoacyl-[acyl-carrier-protein] synthase-3 [Saccharopolyspora gloriosae]